MFYKIIFSEEVIKKRLFWLLLRHTLLSGAAGFGLWLVGYAFVLPSMTVYALSREYAEVYLDLLPRDIALSVGLPVAAEFVWAGSGYKLNHQAFLDSLSKDIQAMDPVCSGWIFYSSSDRVRRSKWDVGEGGFPQVDTLFGIWATNPVSNPKTINLENEVKNDPKVKAYLAEGITPLAVNGLAQAKLLKEQMKGFNETLWCDESPVLKPAFGALANSKMRPEFFQIDPQLTIELLETGDRSSYREKRAAWRKLAGGRFSLNHKMYNDLSKQIVFLRNLDSETPMNKDAQFLFSQAEWLLNTATNFFTLKEIEADKPKSRIAEIAEWAGFKSRPVVTVGGQTNGKALFSQSAFQITMSDATPISFRQYADFYRCLVNEPERFQILSVSDLEVEIRGGAAYVKRFEFSGEIVGVNPEKLRAYQAKVVEAKRCFEDIRKVYEILNRSQTDRSRP